MTQSFAHDLLTLVEEPLDFSDDVFVFPVSFAQQRLWFLDQFEPGSPYYNIPTAVRLKGPLDIDVLEQTINEIVRRHESLRTVFRTWGGEPVQIVFPDLILCVPVTDLRRLPPEKREREAMRLATEEAMRPFDLTRGPLLRVSLLYLDESDYLVLLTMHHIVSDGWSMGVLIGEIAAIYNAFSRGWPSPLPSLPIQYADFAEWQRGWLQGEVLQSHLTFWREQLGGGLPVLELPTDRPHPAVQTNKGGVVSRLLPRGLVEALKLLGQQEHSTLFMTLLAAFQALLHRYSGQEDFGVGSPIANRNRGEIEGLIGVFINTLVFRADLAGDPTFRELLARVREVSLGAFAHQDLPFEMLVDELQIERDMAHTPLFQVMFILQNAPTGAQKLPDLELELVDVHPGTSTFDLTLSMSEGPAGLDASVEYNSDLFDRETMERMLAHLEVLLAGVVADPERRVSELPLLTETERHRLLFEWNHTAAELSLPLCFHQLFEAQVVRTPDAEAVVAPAIGGSPRRHLTYDQLNRQANQLAHYLRGVGVGPETVVGVCTERAPEMIVATMGVLKAGGAYLPLDPLYPRERLAHMLEDSQVPVLLTQSHLLDGLPLHAVQPICLDTDWEAIARQSDQNPVNQTLPDHAVYMIYTSGSTGQSKGVVIEHRNLVNAFLAWQEAYDLRAVRSHLQMANFAFDVFSGDLARALGSGGKLVLCPREWLLAPEQLYTLMRQEAVDIAEFVPAVLRQLMQYLAETGERLDFVRLLICGSDSWYVDEYRRFREFCGPDTRLINSFGLTEATIDSSCFESSLSERAGEQLVPIGRPFANMRLYVLDERLQPLPIGVPGQLYVGGAGVARGYHRRPEMTDEKFITDPFSSDPTARLYKTGDLARFLRDGNVEFLGRMDHQVKIRGFRVEPGEIEAVLGGHFALRQAVVQAVEVALGDKRLVAYVVPNRETEPTPGDLRRFLQERLPDYMVPSTFVFLQTLPLTPNGKVDRAALPEPDWSRREVEGEYVPPRTPVEEVLTGIWSKVLGVVRAGVHDNFFELGGHSLLATQLVSRVRAAFQIDLPLRKVFESPTVAALAEQIEVARRAAAGVQAPPIRPVPRTEEMTLSFAQQRLWFLDQLEPNSPFYNIPEAMRFRGPLDADVLAQCLNEVVRRHEVLRTTFRTQDGRPAQVIAPEMHLSLPLTDLGHLPAEEREAEALRLAQEEAQRPFDLARGPLLRARLLRLEQQDHFVLLTMHHIAGDDWSTGVLVQEISILYQAFSQGQFSPLPPLFIQYADFAHWQREWLQGEVLERHLDYWTGQLRGLPPLLELPTDRPRPAVQSYRGDYRTFALSPELSRAIKELGRQEGATLFMTLLAAFQTLLYRYSGQEDISVGTPIANRNRAEVEGLIGFFVNTLVIRGDLSGGPSFRELLGRLREAALGAYAHQDLPFEMVVDALQPDRDMSHSPLFQVMFALQNAPASAQPLADVEISAVEAHSGTAKFDLTLFMAEQGAGLGGALEYNSDLFDGETIERLIGHYQTLLAGIVAAPEQSIDSLPLLTEAERQQLVVTWNQTEAPYPAGLCVHELFAAQAARTPEAAAVVYEGQQMSYGELDRRSNQVAHYLQRLGVGPERLVGVCMERVPEMVAALLGVLKAGGAYVPLDPSYPAERLAFMLADAGVQVLLTQAHLKERMGESARHTVCLDAGWEMMAGEEDTAPVSDVRPDNLAYVIYTSGSTGRPKGAMVLHRGVVNYLTWCQQAYPVAVGGGSPVHSSISFDLTVTSLFSPLVVGRAVELLPEELGVELLSTALRKSEGYGLVKITPAHLELLSQQMRPEEAAGRTRAFIIGGEQLLGEHIAFWQAHAPETVLVNEYGPTETVVGCCVYQVGRGERVEGAVPIGRPIINSRLYILDGQMQPAPVGVPGELYIGGVGVGRGYLNRPELTAERFIADPFSPDPAARLYKTGDLCRYRRDGHIEFLGRMDHQVKVRGFRIELGEVEAALGGHEAVQEVVVLAREDEPGRKRLVAYVVWGGAEVSVGELRGYLSERLPEYMVPAAFVTLEGLPLTPNGKVDRKALPAPDETRPELEAAYEAPRTAAEETLAGIWAAVLGVEQVGVHDSFFELGGDSILSIQVVARANQAGLRLTPRQLFERPTVAGLAAVAGKGPAIQAEQGLVEGEAPLTPIQRWFLECELAEAHHWNQAILLEVRQPLEREVLEETVRQLLGHHDALRLRYERGEGGWRQWNSLPEEGVPFSWVELAGLEAAEQRAAIETHAAALQGSLNLEAGPLMRLAYFDVGEGQAGRLLLVVHHLAIDGVSWRILLEDLMTAYQQLSQGAAVQLPAKTTSFQAWARRLMAYGQSDQARQELPFWLDVIHDGESSLPVDYPGGENTEASARSVTVSLSVEETQALLYDVPATYRTEINDVLLTALAQAAGQWTGRRSLLVDVEGHGREDIFDDVDVSRTVGWFTALFPVRLDMADSSEPGEALMRIKEQLCAIPRRGIGYGVLRYLDESQASQPLRAAPPAEISFNYLGQMDQGLPQAVPFLPAQESRGLDRGLENRRTHLLEVDGAVSGGRLHLEWSYSENLHRRETIEKLAASYKEALLGLIRQSETCDAIGFVPSDFVEFEWDQEDLTDIMSEISKVMG
ncbi:MAG: amino acid adenylation domain-containing protein [Chloroflexota bacterium]